MEFSPQLPVLQQVDFLCSPSVGDKPLTLPTAAANGAPAAPAAPAGKFCVFNLFSVLVNCSHVNHFSTRSRRRYNWRTWQCPTRNRQSRGRNDSASAEARTDWHGDAHRRSWSRENLGGKERGTKPKPKPHQENRVERAPVGDRSARGDGLGWSGCCAFIGERWAFASLLRAFSIWLNSGSRACSPSSIPWEDLTRASRIQGLRAYQTWHIENVIA